MRPASDSANTAVVKDAPITNPVCVVLAAFMRLALPRLFKWEVHGLEHIPRGPALIVSNHLGVFDPPATLMALRSLRPPRHLYHLAKDTLFNERILGVPYLAFLLRQIESIPLNPNEADLSAFKRAIKLLHEGRLVGIFPEGGITWTHQPKAPLSGLALLAHIGQVPVIPMGIIGTRPLWWRDAFGRIKFNQIKMRFGPPMEPPLRKSRMNEDARRAYTQSIMDECYRLVHQLEGH